MRYGYTDALREAWHRDPAGFVVGLLLVPPAVLGAYVLLVGALVMGGAS